MNLIVTSLILILANGVRSESCDADVTDFDNNVVDFENECGSEIPCLIKCCGKNEVIHFYKKKYVCKTKEQLGKEIDLSRFNDSVLSNYSDLIIKTDNGTITLKKYSDFKILHREKFLLKQCAFNVTPGAILTEGGSLRIQHPNKINSIISYKAPYFCVDMAVGTKTIKTKDKRQKYTVNYYKYFVRYDEDDSIKIMRSKTLYIAYGNLVSVIFILLVLAVYGMLKKLHGNLQGMLLMAFLASLMLITASQAWVIIYRYRRMDAGETTKLKECKWLGPLQYFLLLSTFAWLNTMSLNIWRIFRRTRNVREHSRVFVKFLMYSLYGWGVPALLTGVALILDSSLAPDSVVRPRIDTCPEDDPENLLKRLYTHAPMALVVFSNIMLFLMTSYNIWIVSSMPGVRADSSRSKKNKGNSVLFLKLSVIMGVGWILELIQALFTDTLPSWLFYLLNAVNLFLGVIIFFLMVFKRSVFIMLCERCGIKNRWTHRGTQNNTSSRTDAYKRSKSYKSSKSYGTTRSTDASMEFESISVNNADTLKVRDVPPLGNPRFTVTRV